MRAAVKYVFRSPLGQQNRLTFRVRHQDRHHAPSEVERELIQLLIFLDHRLSVEVGTIQNRPVEQILEARLEVADQVTIQEYLLGFTSSDVAMPHENHAVLGESTSL